MQAKNATGLAELRAAAHSGQQLLPSLPRKPLTLPQTSHRGSSIHSPHMHIRIHVTTHQQHTNNNITPLPPVVQPETLARPPPTAAQHVVSPPPSHPPLCTFLCAPAPPDTPHPVHHPRLPPHHRPPSQPGGGTGLGNGRPAGTRLLLACPEQPQNSPWQTPAVSSCNVIVQWQQW